jgi:hypothetical protein
MCHGIYKSPFAFRNIYRASHSGLLICLDAAGASLSERIATALINGSWFLRILRPFAHRLVIMHGHRHIDWIGTCGSLRIISAPSPVMGRKDAPTHFYVHSLAAGADGSIRLLAPQRVEIEAFTR